MARNIHAEDRESLASIAHHERTGEWLTYAEAEQYDTASSVSRQHYVDTGEYLTHDEVAEWELR